MRTNGNTVVSHSSNRHKKDLLSPVPETSTSGARVLEVSAPHNSHHTGHQGALGSGGAFHYSSESVNRMLAHQHTPADRTADCNGDGGAAERDMNGHILVRGSSFSSGAASTHPPPSSVLSSPLRGSMGSIASQSRGRGQGEGHAHHGGVPSSYRQGEHGRVLFAKQGSDLPRDTSYHSTISNAGRYGELQIWWDGLGCLFSVCMCVVCYYVACILFKFLILVLVGYCVVCGVVCVVCDGMVP